MARVLVAGLCVLASSTGLGRTYERIHSFGGPGAPTALVQGRDGALYGVSQEDGDFAEGSVFRILPDGTFETLHSFHVDDGAPPFSALVVAPDGELYGTARAGGARGLGAIFKVDRAGHVRTLHSFDGTDGANPEAPLALGADGAFYGTTSTGGTSSGWPSTGTVYRVDRQGRVEKIHDFGGDEGTPSSPLVAAGDGSLYATTQHVDRYYPWGNIFKIDASGSFSTVYDGHYWGTQPLNLFAGSDGAVYWFDPWLWDITLCRTDATGSTTVVHSFQWADAPSGRMVQMSDGSFYGTTTFGGSGYGTVFKLDAQGQVTTLHGFSGSDGAYPSSELLEAEDGALYGTTSRTNAWGSLKTNGSLFTVDTRSGTFTSLHVFDGADGACPGAGLTPRDGELFGTTAAGGSFGHGTVFRLARTRTLATLHEFRNGNGSGVWGPLLARDGMLLGAAYAGGGLFGRGTIFEIRPDGRMQTLHVFDGQDIACPSTPLVVGSDHALYGAAAGADSVNLDTADVSPSIFRFGADASVQRLHALYGGIATAPLTLGADGALYGITNQVGSSFGGMVFRVDGEGRFVGIHTFGFSEASLQRSRILRGLDGALYGAAGLEVFKIETDGRYRQLYTLSEGEGADAGLLLGRDGALYATTGVECSSACSVFRIGPDGEFRPLYAWSSSGVWPSPLVEGPDGAFYGTTLRGASNGGGTIYRVDREGHYELLHEFEGGPEFPTGSTASLITGRDGALYGTASGTVESVFRVDTRGRFRTIHVLDAVLDGRVPGTLFEDGAGDLYGLTSWGGPLDGGTLFRIGIDLPGDVDGNGVVDVRDVFVLIDFLFAGGPRPEGPADVNADGRIDVRDVYYLISFLFEGGPAPLG